MKIYIGRDHEKLLDYDRIFFSTRKLKWLSNSKRIAQPQHNNWNILELTDFKIIKYKYKKELKHITLPKIGQIICTEIDPEIFNYIRNYYTYDEYS